MITASIPTSRPSASAGLPAPPNGRLDSLTGLRFIAAFMVLVSHVTAIYAPIPALTPVAQFGGTGVTFFFVLSGFVLTWSWREGDRTRDFYWRRLARVWPLHLVVLLPAALIIAGHYGVRPGWRAALSVPLLQAWVPTMPVYYGGNLVAWSLSCEFFFYAVFPLAIRLGSRLSGRRLAAAIATLPVLMSIGEVVAHATLTDPLAYWALTISPPYRLTQFLLGVLLAVAVRRGVRLNLRLLPAVALVAVNPALIAAGVQAYGVHLKYVLLPLTYGVLILAAAEADLRGRASFLRNRIMVLLGHWSFALYLVHMAITFLFLDAAGGHPRAAGNANLLSLLSIAAVSVVVSAALFTLVERPVERWMRAHVPWRSRPQPADGRLEPVAAPLA